MTFLYSTLVYLFALFSITLVHVVRGAGFKFLITLNLMILQSIICYAVYCYQYEQFVANEATKTGWRIWWFLAIMSFQLYHWLLANRYFTSAREMPFVLADDEVPDKLTRSNKILNYIGVGCCVVSSFFAFEQ
jgi:hypothetical protein